MAKDYGLLIAALVAIVAIVGLVILFSGSQTGSFVDPGYISCDPGFELQNFVGSGGQLSYAVCVRTEYPGVPSQYWR